MIFTELVEFVERHTSLPVAEQIISEADLKNTGAFTSVGDYPYTEALKLVSSAATVLGSPTKDLMRQFGQELFHRLLVIHPQFFADRTDNAFSFLSRVQSHIHTEVAKLYPNSKPPTVDTSIEDGKMTVSYASHRPFAMIALGLLEGCCAHFDDSLTVGCKSDLSEAGTQATFTVTKASAT